MMLWFTNLSSWVSFALLVGIANAIAVGATLLVRAWSRRRGVTTAQVVVPWATALGGLFAVLCGFTIITLWTIFARAASISDREATAIRLSARDISPTQLPALRAYVSRSAAEWPQLCGGKPIPASLLRW